MQRWWLACGCSVASCLLCVLVAVWPIPALAQEAGEERITYDTDVLVEEDTDQSADDDADMDAAAPAEDAAAEAPAADQAPAAVPPGGTATEIRNDFVNFLHFATIGRFDFAQAHAQSLLDRPDVNPLSEEAAATLIDLSRERPQAIETLVILINNSTIGEEAGKIMGLIRQAHRTRRMDAAQINRSIRLLAGNPSEQATGLERLIDSGEYAIPHMLRVLADPHESGLHPYLVRALPRIGKPAVNPLTAAMSLENEVVRRVAAEALGRIGYPQALPYLKRAATSPQANPAVRQTANEALRQIVVADPGLRDAPAELLFAELAEGYYAEDDSLAADRKDPRANVWVVEGPTIKPIDVPVEIFCMVMSMQASKASLELNRDQPQVLSLWLAANFRRESLLGLDVQTSEKVDVDDPTRPADFPRGIYFARSAGPAVCNLVLHRGLTDMERPVILGAIAGLAATAGPGDVQPQVRGAMGLPDAIRFPDQLVRLRAALVLARVLPQQAFPGANEVVPVLASAFSIDGRKSYLLIEPDAQLAEQVAAELGKDDSRVVAADRLELGLARAARQFTQIDAVFLASDMAAPGPVQAVQILGRDERAALAPVVLAVKEGGMLIGDRVVEADPRVGRVLVNGGALGSLLVAKAEQVARNYGYTPLTAEDGVALSLEANRALQWVAANQSPIFDPRAAEPALVQALNKHGSEEVRIGATRVLALLNTPTSQDAIAKVALSGEQSETLRTAAFASLAESARWLGNRLSDSLRQELIQQAMSEPNLELRTAASQALGATINMPAELAVDAILRETRGG